MYRTAGIDAVATITELRSNTTELIEHVRETHRALLIQKNNEPYAVLLDWQTYQYLLGATGPGEPVPDAAAASKTVEAKPGR